MFRNNIFTILLFGSSCAGVTTASAEVIFSDSFESGDISATNADGFAWGGNNRTSVVTQDPANGSVKLWENGPSHEILSDLMPDGSDREYTTEFGDNSLRFKYHAYDSGVLEPQWTEQRFDFGKGYPEIWVSYHIRVPLNYARGSKLPPGNARNNKWLVILMSNMGGYGSSEITLFSNLDRPNVFVDDITDMKMSSAIRIGDSRGWTSETQGYVDFVTPADAGRWMEVIYYLKANSAPGVDDGVYKMYRKWANENAFTLIDSIDPAPMPISQESIDRGYNGWGGGYFMGWANDSYSQETEWLIDNIVIADTPLLPNPPKPPVNVGIEVIK